ncbi:GatB/YqeY domain-containing protein [Corallococcus sp. AS-1-12]|uniref:GatB/YqeY domain-containing protein n=1 Tax=Corallococcus sp. AS-1-12 TaxID=2874598 RepID=UPI001CC0CA5F|nr:GatB/YqeY domain-containing protein [Corallococcus sp. AS-1-12]MBZ4332993.1 GatB/YqeY domain-containing protein [Corallococcus sp. AS-1-12]
MKTVTEWKATLRASLKEALRTRNVPASAVLRETLAAIDNAEAPDVSVAPRPVGGDIAGSAGGLGSGEVARLLLSPEAVEALVQRELQERRDAVALYTRLGKHEEARTLQAQVEVLLAL